MGPPRVVEAVDVSPDRGPRRVHDTIPPRGAQAGHGGPARASSSEAVEPEKLLGGRHSRQGGLVGDWIGIGAEVERQIVAPVHAGLPVVLRKPAGAPSAPSTSC
jgi:hypothetical protein